MIDYKTLGNVLKGTQFYDFIEEVKLNVADIRKPVNVKPEIQVEVRVAVCEVIDEMIISKLKVNVETEEKGEDNWQ